MTGVIIIVAVFIDIFLRKKSLKREKDDNHQDHLSTTPEAMTAPDKHNRE